jgi:hypothetical protein
MMGSSGGRALRGLVLAFYTILFLFTFHEADEDVWGRMAVGRLVLDSVEFPYEDVFAYVPTKSPWVDHEWLSGVVFYTVHEKFGAAGLVWVRALAGLGAVLLVVKLGGPGVGTSAAACVMSVATAVLVLQGFNGVVRAQVFSFLLFASFWWLLERPGKLVWLLVPASALWANLHGGVVVGVFLIAVYAACSSGRRRSLVVVGALATAATLANPYGIHYWTYLAGALSMSRPEIVEWGSVTLTPLLADLHVKLAMLVVVLVVALAPRSVRPPRAIVLGATLVASWMHLRFTPFLGLAMVVALPRAVESLFEKGQAAFPKRWVPSLAPLAATVLLVALFLTGAAVAWRHRDLGLRMTVPPDRYPVAAVRVLERSKISGRLAVYFNWGEYALYHLHPRIRVSIDGRYETVYPDDVVRANWDFTRDLPGAETLLDRYPADFALYPTNSGAARRLDDSAAWERVHWDDASVLYSNSETIDGKSLKTSLVLIENTVR